MKSSGSFVAVLIALLIAAGPVCLGAQERNAYSTTAQAASTEKPTPTMLRLTVTISRFQGEKKTGSVPFVLVLITGLGSTRPTSIQMGSKVPMSTTAIVDGKPSTTTLYEQLGTNINAYIESVLSDGRYSLNLSVTDSQLVGDTASGGKTGGLPLFQTFKASNTMAMRDGDSLQFTVATDKASGEVVKLDVTINVIK